MGQAHDPFMAGYLAVDQLVHATLLVLGDDHADLLGDESERVVRQLIQQAEAPLAAAAERVLAARDATGSPHDPVSAQ
jgi:hypothetical protein